MRPGALPGRFDRNRERRGEDVGSHRDEVPELRADAEGAPRGVRQEDQVQALRARVRGAGPERQSPRKAGAKPRKRRQARRRRRPAPAKNPFLDDDDDDAPAKIEVIKEDDVARAARTAPRSSTRRTPSFASTAASTTSPARRPRPRRSGRRRSRTGSCTSARASSRWRSASR